MRFLIGIQPTFKRAFGGVLPMAVGVVALAFAVPAALRGPTALPLIGMNALFIWISVNDLKTRRVPNQVTYPLMLMGLVRAIACQDVSLLPYWAAIYLLWSINLFGGGDAKLLMGLFGLFPDFQLARVLSISILVTGLPYLAYKYRRTWRTALRALLWRLVSGQLLPSQSEFERKAVPFAFSFCLGCGAYLFIRFWSLLGWG